jgi:PDDEXK-like uncharacterized protein DUF3799
MTGKILSCTPEEYHRDPCGTPSLSASAAHLMLTRSPLHCWTKHPKLGSMPDPDGDAPDGEEDSEAFANGKILHKLILGKGAEISVIDCDSFRSNAAKEARDIALNKGRVPILKNKFQSIADAAGALMENCKKLGFDLKGQAELPIEWTTPGAAGPVLCRSMLDLVNLETLEIIDVKTIRNAHPEHIARKFVEHGYDIQEHAYKKAVESLNPSWAGRTRFTFLFMELQPPYAVVPVRPDGAHREIGKLRWQRAVSLWETCLARNHWPCYTTEVIQLEPPAYVAIRELGNEGTI